MGEGIQIEKESKGRMLEAKLLVFERLFMPDTVLVTVHPLFCVVITLTPKNRWFGYYQ